MREGVIMKFFCYLWKKCIFLLIVVATEVSYLSLQRGHEEEQSHSVWRRDCLGCQGFLRSWKKRKRKYQSDQWGLYEWTLCISAHMHEPSLLGLGANQQPQGASYAEGLANHGFNLRERPEEKQVLVDGVDLPAHLQASHLHGQTDRQETECGYL